MDPVDTHRALAGQGQLLGRHKHTLEATRISGGDAIINHT